MLSAFMRDPVPPLIELWQRTALESAGPWRSSLGEAEIAWAIQTGMASLLSDALGPEPLEEPLATRLAAASRWARFRYADSLAAAIEILDACRELVAPLTLLKGISIGPERYPAPHHRFLGDLDLLVEPDALKGTLGALDELGYAMPAPALEPGGNHHHLPALQHPSSGVLVEIHTGLFPESDGFGDTGPFAASTVSSERRASTLEGRQVYRLSPELQLLYIASHWALDFAPAPGARALLDMLLLVRAEGEALDWDCILGWLGDRRISAHLQLMLACLEAWDLIEIPGRLRAHWGRSPALSRLELDVLIGMAERYQVRGLMADVPDLSTVRRETTEAPITGTLGSRLTTLKTAFATRNLLGLLPILDRLTWRLLRHPGSGLWRRLAVRWCGIFAPGDPRRFAPRWMSRSRAQ